MMASGAGDEAVLRRRVALAVCNVLREGPLLALRPVDRWHAAEHAAVAVLADLGRMGWDRRTAVRPCPWTPPG